MANPRQRRKSRSGTAKVSHSRASIKNKHKVIVKGPSVLVENWDKKKTVRQNYRILGLMPNLNPRQAGGIEPVEGTPYAVSRAVEATLSDLDSDSADEESEDEDVPMASTSAPRKLALGEGRIVRDAEGKVIRIEMGGEDGEQVSEEVKERVAGESESDDDDEEESDEEEEEVVEEGGQTPWGAKMEVWDGEESEEEELKDEVPLGPRKTGQGIPIGVRTTKVLAKTDVVRELEALAATQRKVVRHTSAIEADWLVSLVAKYGDDVESMARDRKVNVWQKTVGEIKRQVMKAGGWQKLMAKAIQAEEDREAAEVEESLVV